MAPPPAAPSGSGSRRVVLIAGLVFLGVLLLCGVAGTCLLVLSFFVPT